MHIGRLLILGLFLVCINTCAYAAQVTIACGSYGQEFQICKDGAQAWAKNTGNTVNFLSTPNDSNERLALYQQFLASGDSSVDIFQVDTIWIGILHRHFINLSPHVPASVLREHFPAIIANNTVNGQLIAMPLYTDAGVLYYRKDLLEKYHRSVPSTWQELEDTAHIIQNGERKMGNPRFWGFVFQGRAYEGLTCDALEWIESFGGGNIVEKDGRISINNPQAIKALQTVASWINTISPKGVLNYNEEESRGVFQSGDAAFLRNWPYVWDLTQSPDSPVKGKVGVTMLPAGTHDGNHAATLGGWQLAVSRYSKSQKEAIDLVMYLTSAKEQKRRAIVGSFNPTIMSLYKDPEVLKAVPFFGTLYNVFVNAYARPASITGRKYNQLSAAFWNAVHETLEGSDDAASSLKGLERRLQRISNNGTWGSTNAN